MSTPTPPPSRDPNAPPSPFSDKLGEILDALECLYIRGNNSGRRLFMQNWPAIVPYLFDEELVIFDAEGVSTEEQRVRRRELEKAAEDRRDILIPFLETLEEKSVNDGMLQVEFVRDVMMRYRREMLLYLYSEHIVNKFVPPAPKPEETVQEQAAPEQEPPKGEV